MKQALRYGEEAILRGDLDYRSLRLEICECISPGTPGNDMIILHNIWYRN